MRFRCVGMSSLRFGCLGIFCCVSCCPASWSLAGMSVYDALMTALRKNDKTIKTSRNADNKKKDDNRHKAVFNNHNKNNSKVNNSDNNDNDNTCTKNDNNDSKNENNDSNWRPLAAEASRSGASAPERAGCVMSVDSCVLQGTAAVQVSGTLFSREACEVEYAQ